MTFAEQVKALQLIRRWRAFVVVVGEIDPADFMVKLRELAVEYDELKHDTDEFMSHRSEGAA